MLARAVRILDDRDELRFFGKVVRGAEAIARIASSRAARKIRRERIETNGIRCPLLPCFVSPCLPERRV